MEGVLVKSEYNRDSYMSRRGDDNEDGEIQISFQSYQLLYDFQKSRVGK